MEDDKEGIDHHSVIMKNRVLVGSINQMKESDLKKNLVLTPSQEIMDNFDESERLFR